MLRSSLPSAVPLARARHRAAPKVLWALVLALGLGACAAGVLALAQRAGADLWKFWLGALPLFVVCLCVALLFELALEHARATLGPGNLVAARSEQGILLCLRSHLNWRFPADSDWLLVLEPEDLVSYDAVRESPARPFESDRAGAARTFLRITLSHTRTDELRKALCDETTRTGPRRRLLWFTWHARHRHSPLELSGPAELLVERTGPELERWLEQMGVQKARPDAAHAAA